MKLGIAKKLLFLAQIGMFALVSGASFADHPPGYALVDGIAVYYAMTPAEMIRGYPKSSPEYKMHGGPPSDRHIHHVMIALFDSKTNERITTAEVTAAVKEIGLAAKVKKLKPMTIADALTYGNYFHFSNLTTYKVEIRILKAGSTKSIKFSFEFKHH